MPDQPSNAAARTVYRTCPLCEATCGLELSVVGERVTRIRGDSDDVLSSGYLCPKGVALGELHDDPDRLRAPLLREGTGFREASWEEAFARVADGLAPYLATPERSAIGAYIGNPTVHNLGGALFLRPFLKALRTRQLFTAATVDQIPKHVASGLLFGSAVALPVPDVDRCDYLLMLGANPWESNGSLWTAPDLPRRLRDLRRRGGRLVVVDPRRTRTAAHADRHLAIRPGTDALWLLALIQVISADGLARPGRLAGFTTGLDALAARVAAFTPEAVAGPCDIDAETTRRVAHDLAAAPRAAVYGRIGTHANRFGTLAAWATEVLNLITGNLDREGGVMFPRAPHDRLKAATAGGTGFATGRWRSRVSGHPEVMGELPAACLAEEIETPGAGQIRALVTVAGNPVLSTPNGARLDRALAGLDFMVSVDVYLNETTRHADVILPPPSPLERSHYDYFFLRFAVRSVANWSQAVFPSEAPDEADILMRLALIARGESAAADPTVIEEENLRSLIAREAANPASPIAGCEVDEIRARVDGNTPCERVVDFLVRTGPFGDGFAADSPGLSLAVMREHPHGIDFGPMQPQLPDLIETPSGKLELDSMLIDAEIAKAAATIDAVRAADELLLIGRREFHSNNSWMHNLASLIERPERCTLRMHAADALQRGLDDGCAVRVRSSVGEVVAPLEIHAEMRPGVVSLPHGYGHHFPGMRLGRARAHAGVSANDLVTGAIDAPSGNAILNALPVEVSAT
ncbi:MAG: molybdopterin-dependent oxidoreductase [Gammaproteobacteria bacterium]